MRRDQKYNYVVLPVIGAVFGLGIGALYEAQNNEVDLQKSTTIQSCLPTRSEVTTFDKVTLGCLANGGVQADAEGHAFAVGEQQSVVTEYRTQLIKDANEFDKSSLLAGALSGAIMSQVFPGLKLMTPKNIEQANQLNRLRQG